MKRSYTCVLMAFLGLEKSHLTFPERTGREPPLYDQSSLENDFPHPGSHLSPFLSGAQDLWVQWSCREDPLVHPSRPTSLALK